MKGGGFLGQGSYGCAFDETPICASIEEKNPNASPFLLKKASNGVLVTKVFPEHKDFDMEWKNAQMVATVDPLQKCFVYSISRCDMSKVDLKKMGDAQRCNIPCGKEKTVGILKMPYAGIPMDQALKEKGFRNYKKLLACFLPLFDGLKKLNQKGYMHHDLKYDNILYNPDSQRCKIIDFGLLMEHKDGFKEGIYHLDYGYWIHPPEYKLVATLYKSQTPVSPSVIRQHMSEFFRSMDSGGQNISQIYLRYLFNYEELQNIWNVMYKRYYSYAIQGRSNLYNASTKHVAKVDMYGLGICLMICLKYSSGMDVVSPRLLALLRGMCHPDAQKRYNYEKAKKEIVKYIRETSTDPSSSILL